MRNMRSVSGVALVVACLLLYAIAVQRREDRSRLTFESHKTIVPAAQLRHLFHTLPDVMPDNVTGYWTPSTEDIARVEAALPELFPASDMPPRLTPLRHFYRQYSGFLQSGHRMVFINAFVDPGNVDWQSKSVPTGNTASAFFATHYDVEYRRFALAIFSKDICTLGIPPGIREE